MTGQHTDAAERSAHVARGASATVEHVSPCVVTPEGYRLRAVIDAEQRCALLAAKLGEVEEERNALRARAERAEAALRDLLPFAEAAHEDGMAAQGHTGKPWPDDITEARYVLRAIPDAPG